MAEKLLLLVEDNPNDEALVRIVLQDHGFDEHLCVVKNGLEAIQFVNGSGKFEGRNQNRKPQLILLDLKMPKVSGLEVLKQLRQNEQTRQLPVVIFTSSKEEKDLVGSYNIGVNSYVYRSIEFQEFSTTIIQVVTYWLELNQTPPEWGN